MEHTHPPTPTHTHTQFKERRLHFNPSESSGSEASSYLGSEACLVLHHCHLHTAHLRLLCDELFWRRASVWVEISFNQNECVHLMAPQCAQE